MGQLPCPNQDPNSSQQDLDDQVDFLTTCKVESDLSSTDEDIKDVLQDASDGRPNEQSVHEKVSQNFFFFLRLAPIGALLFITILFTEHINTQ